MGKRAKIVPTRHRNCGNLITLGAGTGHGEAILAGEVQELVALDSRDHREFSQRDRNNNN